MNKIFFILILFCSCKHSVTVKRCIDGDTFITSTGERIRLAYIDAPEHNQDEGQAAKQALIIYLSHGNIRIERTGRDKYKRTVAKVYSGNNYVNEEMILSGNAWAYKRFTTDKLYSEEQNARQKKIGLWAKSNPIPPFIFRRNKK